MKRFLSFIVTMALALSMMPVVGFGAEVRTIYWDPVNGADSNSGRTESAPLKTKEKVYTALSGADEGILVMLDTLKLTAQTNFPASNIPVTITSKTGAEGIASSANINFNGETKLEKLTLTLTKASTSALIGGGGHPFTIGKTVTCVPFVNTTDDYYFCLQGGLAGAGVASTDLTVESGQFRNIYFGSMSRVVSGDAKLTMTGGKAAVVAPSYSGSVDGNVSATIGGNAQITGYLYAGSWTKGDIGGNVEMTLQKGASVYRLFCAGNGTGNVTGTVTVNWDGMESAISNFKGKGNTSHSGTIGGSRLVLKSGILPKAPSNFDAVDIDIPADRTLVLATDLNADNVTGSGTLRFSGPVKLTAASVTGTVNCVIEGEQFNNHAYITAPAGSGFVFPNSTITENNGTWICKDLENFQGLVLTAEKGVTITLYTGFDPESSTVKKVEPYAVEGNTKYYPALQGNYYYRASGTGYYKVKKNIYMSPEKAMTKTVIDVTPGKKSGLGWEPDNETVKYYTDEFIKNAAPSDPSLWPEFADLFTTPAFGEGRAEHQHTTQAEMETFIAGLDDARDNMYVYSMGTSGRGQNMPLVIFTRVDLTGKTLEEAAALIVADSKATGKLTVHHQAHIHGNEQASGEAALGLIQRLDGAYGESMLDSMNIYVMPRQNPDGAEDNLRRIPTWGLKDPNTDFAQLETKEVQNIVRMMNLFRPHVVIDNHEGNVAVDNDPVYHGYMLTNARYSNRQSEAFRDLGQTMVLDAHDTLRQRDFDVRYIDNIVNGKGIGTILGYAGNQGILAFLIETPGILHGCNNYERRVVGAMICITTYYDYLKENLETVKTVIEAEQQRICDAGKTFEQSDLLSLELAKTKHEEFAYQTPYYHAATGEIKEMRTLIPEVWDTVVRSRVAPTAYVLPAGESWVADVLTIMDHHGISYTKLAAGTTVMLRQYIGSNTQAALTEEQPVTFPEGGYVFTMNTQKAEILANLLEPDMTITARTLTSGNGHYTPTSGETHTYIAPVNGVFPIYRYEHDLNEDGSIDCGSTDTPTEPEVPADYTVYIRQSAADDSGDGYTKATAVKTVDRAYAQLALQMANAPAGTEGTVILLEDYTIPGQSIEFPTCSFPVTITSQTGNEGFIYSPTGAVKQEYRTIAFHGETTLENIKLHYTSGKLIAGMKANGHKLTIGENVDVVVPENGYYLNIYGGTYLFGDDVASTDLTILSGTWRNAYVGGFGKKVLGDARLTVKNASFTAKIMAQYSGGIRGDLYIHLENTNVGSDLHGGGAKDNVDGNVYITLGEGVTAPNIYAGNTTSGNVLGTVTVIADGADLSKIAFHGTAKGTGTVGGAVLQLAQDANYAVTVDPTVSLDLNGYDITGDLTVNGTLTVYDSQTDDYTVSDGACGEITGKITGILVPQDGYIAAANGFHKFDQYISGVSLRPGNAGIYYTATILCDEVLAAQIETSGVAVSLVDLPGTDFETDEDTLYSTSRYGVIVDNILKGQADDADRAIMDIYAASYVKLSDGTVLTSDTEIAYSLYDVLLMLKETDSGALDRFIAQWNLQDWKI